MPPRRPIVVVLLTVAAAVWAGVAWRYATLTAPPESPGRTPVPSDTRSVAPPYRYVDDHADPFYYGRPVAPAVRSGAASVNTLPADAPRPRPSPPPFDFSTMASPPPPPPADEPVSYAPPPYRLSAVLGRTAVLEVPGGVSRVVAQGDWLGPLRVDEIAPTRVRLTHVESGAVYTFPLFD